MRPSSAPLYYTVEEYLALERASEERHEYLDGQIYALAGESLAHGDICSNLIITIGAQWRGSPCRVLTKGTKVRSGPILQARRIFRGLFSYPDLVIVCGEPQCHDAYQDVLLNPTVIIAVLSSNTEAFDRGEEFRRYRTFNTSLSDYVLRSPSPSVARALCAARAGPVAAGRLGQQPDRPCDARLGAMHPVSYQRL